jgi:prophage DNA circulation protein
MSGKLNLNRPADFAALTNSVTADQILQALRLHAAKWKITESSYTGGGRRGRSVMIHILESVADYQAGIPELRDIEGRRKVKIELPYVDGQTTDDLGRKGATFELEIVMYGPLYQNGLIDFMTEINRPEPGTLLHPVRGAVRCGLDEIVSVHSHDYRHCVRMQVRFVEHNFQVSKFGTRFRNKGIANALAGAVVAVQAVGTAIQAVRGAVGIVSALRSAIVNKIAAFQSLAAEFVIQAHSTFSGDASSVVPSVLPVNQGGLAQSKAAPTAGLTTKEGGYIQVGTKHPTIVAPNDPLSNLPATLLSDAARKAVAAKQLRLQADTIRAQAAEIISDINAAANGAMELHEQTLVIKRAAIAAQDVLEAGLSSSRARVILYTVPRTMSVREAAFLNGLTPNQCADVELMNPELDSVNFIPAGTVLQIPVEG